MIRADMITTVGRTYLTSNIENDEYSYPKAFTAASLTFVPIRNSSGRAFEKLDIRFVKDNITVLIRSCGQRLSSARRKYACPTHERMKGQAFPPSGCTDKRARFGSLRRTCPIP